MQKFAIKATSGPVFIVGQCCTVHRDGTNPEKLLVLTHHFHCIGFNQSAFTKCFTESFKNKNRLAKTKLAERDTYLMDHYCTLACLVAEEMNGAFETEDNIPGHRFLDKQKLEIKK